MDYSIMNLRTTTLSPLCASLWLFSAATFAQQPLHIEVELESGSTMKAARVLVEDAQLRVELKQGGTIWLPKSELSPLARHKFFGEPLPEPPKPAPAQGIAPPPSTAVKPVEKAEPKPLLVWKFTPPQESSEPLPAEFPKDVEEIKQWIARYLLEKVKQDVVLLNISGSLTDQNAWWCSQEYEALTAKHAKDPKELKAQLYILVAQPPEHLESTSRQFRLFHLAEALAMAARARGVAVAHEGCERTARFVECRQRVARRRKAARAGVARRALRRARCFAGFSYKSYFDRAPTPNQERKFHALIREFLFHITFPDLLEKGWQLLRKRFFVYAKSMSRSAPNQWPGLQKMLG